MKYVIYINRETGAIANYHEIAAEHEGMVDSFNADNRPAYVELIEIDKFHAYLIACLKNKTTVDTVWLDRVDNAIDDLQDEIRYLRQTLEDMK